MLYSEVPDKIEEFLQQHSHLQIDANLNNAIRYAIFPAGKRFRPKLCLALLNDLQGDIECGLGYACALEILHCASLVHDDLPALDNDLMRRGRPTCHVEFGEATAIIAADLMISLAFQCLIVNLGLNAEKLVNDLLSQASGAWIKLCSGQALDLSQLNDRDQLLLTHRQKTGALMAAATTGAGILAGVDAQYLTRLQSFGEAVGMLFQVTDDLIDQYGDDRERGRLGSSDDRNNRSRIVLLGGREAALEFVEQLKSLIAIELNSIELKANSTRNLLESSFTNVPGLGRLTFQ